MNDPFDICFDDLRKKLCPEGKAAAKRKFKVYPSAYANGWAVQYCKGKFKGKQASIDVNRINTLRDEGINPTEIARQMNISRGSVYRLMKKVEV